MLRYIANAKSALFVIAVCLMLAGCTTFEEDAMHSSTSSQPPVVRPAPAEARLCADYELSVNGRPVPVYECRVSAVPFNQLWPGYQRPLDQTELAGFAYWDMSDPVEVELFCHRPIDWVAVRPTSRHIEPSVERNRVKFRLDAPGQFTVEVNGWHKALHIFANPPESTAPNPDDPNVLYFGPGVHRPGRIVLESGQTVYVAGGAVVHTSIQGRDVSDVHILGRGIIDTSTFERGEGRGCIRLTNCQNAVVDGVVLRDPDVWCLTLRTCKNVTISNVKLIGLWRYNADGIDICNSQDVLVRDSFIRSFDDSIALKGMRSRGGDDEPASVQRVTAERCVVWNDWGRALEIGAETAAPEISDVTFRDCDILRTAYVAMDIQHGDRAAIKNILYEDIRFEIDEVNYELQGQEGPDDKFEPQPDWCPRLAIIEIVKTRYNRDPQNGTVSNVTFRNVSVTGKDTVPSRLQGLDEEHQVTGVTFENLRFNGRLIEGLDEWPGLDIRPFVQDVRLVAD